MGSVGFTVGDSVDGLAVGTNVGLIVVGSTDGEPVGTGVGALVDKCVGAAVGR